ncbi:MAG: (d)CMP kinase [Acidimicrobiia bacterium]
MSRVPPVIAIDGPAGSGKSTVARAVARATGLLVLDTGAMYRAVTLAVLDRGVDPADADAATAVAQGASMELGEVGADTVTLDGRDVSADIRGPAVTAAVSAVSAHPGVREVMVARQRAWIADHGGGVVEGRDIGTVVFPDAPVKVFLTASDEERARRRQRDEEEAARPADVGAVRDALARRDALDSGRVTSPLRPAADALVLDTTGRTVEDVAREIVARYEAAGVGG